MTEEFKEEFNLSEKIDTFLDMNIDKEILYKKDVKEFIRLLKEETTHPILNTITFEDLHKLIDKLAGEKLI